MSQVKTRYQYFATGSSSINENKLELKSLAKKKFSDKHTIMHRYVNDTKFGI